MTKAYRGLNADQSAALAFHYISEATRWNSSAWAMPCTEGLQLPDVAYQARWMLHALCRVLGH
jgi:hypothetical protein